MPVAIGQSTPESWGGYDRRYQFNVITPGQGAILRLPETGCYVPVWVNEVVVVASRGDGFKVEYGLWSVTEFDLGTESEFSPWRYWDASLVTPAPFLEFVDVNFTSSPGNDPEGDKVA